MVVFNYLVPALFLNLTVQNTLQIGNGSLSTGGTLVLGHIITSTLVSEPGVRRLYSTIHIKGHESLIPDKFETQINAKISHANDWPTGDPNGLHDRPNLQGLVSTDDDEYLQIAATGNQTPTPALGAIITGSGEGNLPFGAFQSVFVVSFRTGAAKYKNLEDSIFVASETVRSLIRAGLKISKLYSTETNITLD